MKVKTKNRNYEVEFIHKNPLTSKLPIVDGDAGTYCIVKDADTEEIIANGRSFLDKHDYKSFNKDLGRKIALKRAMRNMRMAKVHRKEFWKIYFNRFPKDVTKERQLRRLIRNLLPTEQAQQTLIENYLTLKTL